MRRAIGILWLLASVPGWAQEEGEDFSRRDRTALLYQTKFLFTEDQVPIVTVGLVEGEREVSFDSEGPLEFWPEGYGGPSIRLGIGRTSCKARIEQGHGARIRYWVALNRLPARDLAGIRRERAAWEGQGLKVRAFQRGSIFGFYGRVLDNRTVTLVEDDPRETMAGAMERRDALAARSGIATLEVFEEVVDRPTGVIEVQCVGQSARMSFPGMVMVGSPEGRPLTLRSVEYGKGFAWHGREDRSYRGRLVLTPDREGRLAVVNAVDAETLLKGLVPSEIYVDAPAAALEAQAIVARGELFAKLGNRHTADPFMVCADVHCQVYKGVGREDPRTSRAVDATRGRMLFHGDGLADSVYGASCGGHSESGEAVWQGSGHDYLVGVPDHPGGTRFYQGERPTEEEVARFLANPPVGTYCGATRYGRESFRWNRFVSVAEIRQGVTRETGQDPGEVRDLRVLDRGASGRVTRLEVIGSAGTRVLSPELRIRKALGGLRSSLVVFERAREGGQEGFRFTGGGFGHGVGMCQVGAIGRAQAGQDAATILKAYYPGTELIQIY
ncbi:MAG TPA: SpoIID/LytB domain-containing protein [Myxococcota bacterium]|nr:SpoIID/LytB domain-containing protein [Myxococcota bacterium]HQK50505.1 SpoIID/LytB domain-containing protein [Myxococcota bacterium]